MIEFLKLQVAALEAAAKSRMQHLQPAYVEAEAARILKALDEIETANQLAKYGVL